jgi:hypothetical protein
MIWALVSSEVAMYVLGFAVWIGGTWTILWWTEDDNADPVDRVMVATFWPFMVALGAIIGVLTSPVWIPILSYKYLFK